MEAAESLEAGSEEWALAHEALSKLRLKRAALDAEEGFWLLRAFRAATHVYFGYASFGEYIERLFGLNRRTTEEKLRVAGALEVLPARCVTATPKTSRSLTRTQSSPMRQRGCQKFSVRSGPNLTPMPTKSPT